MKLSNEQHRLFIEHLPLVRMIALERRRMLIGGLEIDDLAQEGALGLLDAIRRYDPSKGSLKSFARIRIKGAIVDAIRAHSPICRTHRRDIDAGRAVDVVRVASKAMEVVACEMPNPEEALSTRHEIERMLCALRKVLTPGQLRVIDDYYFNESYAADDVSSVTKYQAIKKLRRHMTTGWTPRAWRRKEPA